MTTTPAAQGIPIWGLISATAAPVLMIGGWTLAARLQTRGFDSIVDTISALAARDADRRWVMTAALAGVGVAHGVSALSLRPAAAAGRILLAIGGLATLGVAAAPLPAGGGSSKVHGVAAGIAFVCLALWPALGSRSAGVAGPVEAQAGGVSPPDWPWRRPAGLIATVGLLAALVWFFAELRAGSDRIGLSERVAAGSQALWPFVVVLASRIGQSKAGAATFE